MQYALLLYGDERVWQTMPEDQRREVYARHEAFMAKLNERDALTGGAELQPTTAATTVRLHGDDAAITDGPFAETAEQLAGFYLVHADDLDEAIAIARSLGSSAVEIRPMVEPPAPG